VISRNRCSKYYCKLISANICCHYCERKNKCNNKCLNEPNRCNISTDLEMSRFAIYNMNGVK